MTAEPDPTDIAERLQQAMGGDAFATARVIHFTWAAERDGQLLVTWDHTWDRWTGDYRLSGADRKSDGASWLALFNVDSRQGRVWIGDRELEGEELDEYLTASYGRFINDTYWLLMPWKWLDPGVSLSYSGEAEVAGGLCDVVELTFSSVGLTSNDRYRGYVDRDSGRMVRWSYLLQQDDGSPGEGEATAWDWQDWNEVEPGVWFSQRKTRVGGESPVAITAPTVELYVDPSAEQLRGWFSP
jgi:hypothetical protein